MASSLRKKKGFRTVVHVHLPETAKAKPEFSEGVSSGLLKVLNPWKDVVAAVVGLTGIFYVTGFIVTSTFLARYGISDFSLLKARYLATGTLFLFLSAVVMYPSYFMARSLFEWWVEQSLLVVGGLMKNIHPATDNSLKQPLSRMSLFEQLKLLGDFYNTAQSLQRRLLGNTVLSAVVALSVYALLTWPLWFNYQTTNSTWALLISWLGHTIKQLASWYFACLGFGFVASIYRFQPLFRARMAEIASKNPQLAPSSGDLWPSFRIYGVPNAFWGVLAALLLSLWMIPLFATRLYPNVPPALGGGRSVQVQLVADAESAPLLALLIPPLISTQSAEKQATDQSANSPIGAPRALQPKAIPVKVTPTQEESKPFQSITVTLLDENETSLFLLVPQPTNGARAVRVDKSLVKAVVYQAESS